MSNRPYMDIIVYDIYWHDGRWMDCNLQPLLSVDETVRFSVEIFGAYEIRNALKQMGFYWSRDLECWRGGGFHLDVMNKLIGLGVEVGGVQADTHFFDKDECMAANDAAERLIGVHAGTVSELAEVGEK